MVDRAAGVSASGPELETFTGLAPRASRRLVAQVERRGGRLFTDGPRRRPATVLADGSYPGTGALIPHLALTD